MAMPATESTEPTSPDSERRRIVILGAAGRDFHDFNVLYRNDPTREVVAFTAAQIPRIDDRRYPAALAGPLYPNGIPVLPEHQLEVICRDEAVDEVVFAYSDLPHAEVMHLAARALACGCDFTLPGPNATLLISKRPVIAVTAVRTGCGKSQMSRWIAGRLAERGLRTAVLRHPMPYGDLERQRVQRFATRADLDEAHCTIEEREEYEPYIEAGGIVFAGVDYEAILERAEAEADIVLWDGGNNDWSFIRPDLHITIVDALRPTHITTHYPGEVVARQADVVVVNKASTAGDAATAEAMEAVRRINPQARVLRADSRVELDDPEAVRGKRVLVVDDGPTLTHGGMPHGAGYVAALDSEASEIIDPRLSATPEIAAVFEAYPHLGPVLPAMGYSTEQRRALKATIEASAADCVVAGSPIDLAAVLDLRKPVVRARYAYAPPEDEREGLAPIIDTFAQRVAGETDA